MGSVCASFNGAGARVAYVWFHCFINSSAGFIVEGFSKLCVAGSSSGETKRKISVGGIV